MPLRHNRHVGLLVGVDRLLRAGDIDGAFALLESSAGGRAELSGEMHDAATRIAVTQVHEAYEQAPDEVMMRYRENRGEEEEFLILSQAKYLGRAAMAGVDPPSDPRVHLYRWAVPPHALATSPLSRALLPNGIRNRTPSQYMRDLLNPHREIMEFLSGGDESASRLTELVENELLASLIDGDKDGFAGVEHRLEMVQRLLGIRRPSRFTDAQKSLFSMAIRAALHPLPSTWTGLREEVYEAEGCGWIALHLQNICSSALAQEADAEGWKSLAEACLVDYDSSAEKQMKGVVQGLRRRRRDRRSKVGSD